MLTVNIKRIEDRISRETVSDLGAFAQMKAEIRPWAHIGLIKHN